MPFPAHGHIPAAVLPSLNRSFAYRRTSASRAREAVLASEVAGAVSAQADEVFADAIVPTLDTLEPTIARGRPFVVALASRTAPNRANIIAAGEFAVADNLCLRPATVAHTGELLTDAVVTRCADRAVVDGMAAFRPQLLSAKAEVAARASDALCAGDVSVRPALPTREFRQGRWRAVGERAGEETGEEDDGDGQHGC